MKLNVFVKAIMAGICISIGSWLYISCAYKGNGGVFVGALLFPLGLILILNFDFFLYSGKVCYLFEKEEVSISSKVIDLIISIFGNLIGCVFVAFTMRFAFLENNDVLRQFVENIVSNKVNHSILEVLILSFFCGMLVFFAVEGFKKIENVFAKHLVVIFCIAAFILSGFEHSIANMFYFLVAASFTWNTLFVGFLVIIGNALGGLFVPMMKKVMK